jgi:predicted RNA-binding protein YlqC (UPF0109 family)
MHSGLPLGHAVLRQVYVPDSAVGRIIGRGGETIRELQRKSHARIQVDHAPDNNDNDDEAEDFTNASQHRGVTITGTKEAVFHAEEMIMRLCLCYSSAGSVGSGGGGGEGSSDASSAAAAAAAVPSAEADGEDGVVSYGDANGGIAGGEASSYYRVGRFEAGGAPRTFYVHPPTPQWLQLQHQRQCLPHFAPPPLPVIETDIISCERSDIGYIIGRRGVTITTSSVGRRATYRSIRQPARSTSRDNDPGSN